MLDSKGVGEGIDLERIRGCRVAIDASIWISNITRGAKNYPSTKELHAFCLGLLRRIRKLLMYDMKPVFVRGLPAFIQKGDIDQKEDGE